jgi:CDP-paratose 2-epimerase
VRDIVLVTGSAGLVGSEAARLFHERGHRVVGIDNDMRRVFFGEEASTAWNRARLESELPRYRHVAIDIRDVPAVEQLFGEIGHEVAVVIHAAAQPSHDWAATDPMMDFTVNANGTLVLLECLRRHSPDAAFVFLSTNKVYGDRPNSLPLVELETRWELDPSHAYHAHGVDESMSLDQTLHSLFGVSKVAADVLVQEYGRYFGLATGVFRGGCLTGPSHSGTQLHGFLAYLMKCASKGLAYKVFGHAGKQVRDNIHSRDLVEALWCFCQRPRPGEVYNIGGGRFSNCSMLEAISTCEAITGRRLTWSYDETSRRGDHIWWISDTRRFESHFPEWKRHYDVPAILAEIHALNRDRWGEEA